MCGFSDIRKDKDGYFCSSCRKRMEPEYEEMVTALGFAEQLQEIVTPGTKRGRIDRQPEPAQ